jgi:hypothetical protein
MVKEPAIGQRSMLAASFRERLEVILKSGNFLNRKLARCNQLWLVRDRFYKASGVRNLTFFRGRISAEGWAS